MFVLVGILVYRPVHNAMKEDSMELLKRIFGGIVASFGVFLFPMDEVNPKRELDEDPQITILRGIPFN